MRKQMRRGMMGVVHVVVAVLGLLSVGQSAPVTSCESLIQPVKIEGRDQLLGKWTYLAESTDVTGSKLLTEMFVEGAWAKINAGDESDALSLYQAQKMFGWCFTLTSKLTLKNSTLSIVQPYTASGVLLNTGCTDCLVFYTKYIIGGCTYSGVQLLSRRTQVSAAEMQEFMKQVECLNLPSPAIPNSGKDFCLDESPSQETQTIDLTNLMNEWGSGVLNQFNRTVSSGCGLNKLISLLSSVMPEKQ